MLQRGAEASHSKVRGKIKEKGNKGGARGTRRFLCLPHLKRGCALPYNRLRKEKNNGILPPYGLRMRAYWRTWRNKGVYNSGPWKSRKGVREYPSQRGLYDRGYAGGQVQYRSEAAQFQGSIRRGIYRRSKGSAGKAGNLYEPFGLERNGAVQLVQARA